MKKDKGLSLNHKIILFILTFGAWYIHYLWKLKSKEKDRVIQLIPAIRTAINELNNALSFEKYFSNYIQQRLKNVQLSTV
ncbi:MAG: hypothetical protein P0Y49_10930 [Candidatus Pedobacter colombiensis]|uniref:Uncharacterized protein n=1 Tax=Candidatus Pedobacter colombiensis TaxID=3121371 RepID=A0AAJ5WCA2_9SPHI|nr:hypothetical protein [Pedobacter sp.]WEK21650.1 MAG: hypothetical protein P0Y49_10930 [Pedobacter sp.]